MSSWQADPLGRHQERMRDGGRWTDQVRDRGVVNTDAVGVGELGSIDHPSEGERSATPTPAEGPTHNGRTPTSAATIGSSARPLPGRRARPVKMVRNLLAIFGVAMIIAGYSYGHSTEFKVACVAHKVVGLDLGWFRNLICDAQFDLK